MSNWNEQTYSRMYYELVHFVTMNGNKMNMENIGSRELMAAYLLGVSDTLSNYAEESTLEEFGFFYGEE